jgi:hypothetical protein
LIMTPSGPLVSGTKGAALLDPARIASNTGHRFFQLDSPQGFCQSGYIIVAPLQRCQIRIPRVGPAPDLVALKNINSQRERLVWTTKMSKNKLAVRYE